MKQHPNSEIRVRVKSKKIFHRRECHWLTNTSDSRLEHFIDREQAIRKGLVPCKHGCQA
jgi:methylphosphotriester-DNA--protein-cysteine methyltransferase